MQDNTTPTQVCDDGNLCGEGPIWDADNQRLFWTDCAGAKFFVLDWKSGIRQEVLTSFEVNGCALDRSGALIFVNNTGVWAWDQREAPRRLFTSTSEQSFPLNDCVADPKGRLIAGSTFYNPMASYDLGQLFIFEKGRPARVLDEGFHLSNGLGFSKNGAKLYFADSIARTVYVYSYDPESGDVAERKVFVKLKDTDGLPDGLTVDAEDHVWFAQWYGGRISRYTPEGKLEREILVPAKQPSSLTFAGPQLSEIFVTTAARSEPMPVMPPAYDAVAGYFGGALFRIRQNIQGRLEHRTDLL